MKKALILILAAVLAVSICVTSAFAANNGNVGQNLVDADRDGICDYRETYQQSVGGKNFVDADNNGICDNAGKRLVAALQIQKAAVSAILMPSTKEPDKAMVFVEDAISKQGKFQCGANKR